MGIKNRVAESWRALVGAKSVSRDEFWGMTATRNDLRRGQTHSAVNFDLGLDWDAQ